MSNGQPPGPGSPPQPVHPPHPAGHAQPAHPQGAAPPQQYGQPQPQGYPQAQPSSPGAPAPRPQAQAPQGSTGTAGGGEVLYEGIAKHSSNIGTYLKWLGVGFVGAGIAFGLNLIDAVGTATWGKYLWALSALGLPGLTWAWLVHVNNKYKITRRRVETETGVLTKSVHSLELWRVLDIQYTQSLLDRLFGNAKISLIGTDQSDPVLVLHGMPGHRKLFEELREAIQVARHTSRPMELVPGHDMEAGGMGEFVG